MSVNIVNSFKLAIPIPPVTEFASMYESFQELTSLQVSHFVEWFSGSLLDTIWNLTSNAGTGITATMFDGIDGGLGISSTSVSEGTLNFNQKRHYDPTGSIILCIAKQDAVNYDASLGFSNSNAGAAALQQVSFHFNNSNTFMKAQSAAGGINEVDTSVNNDFLEHSFKIECGSADLKYTIDGVLDITKTTNRPTASLQPVIQFSSSNGAGLMHLRYLEVFNTSVTILSSLYERLSALTQVLRQRFVSTFSGALLNQRWTSTILGGSGTNTMSDEVDGGLVMATGGASDNRQEIDFNGIRPIDETNSVVITIWKTTPTVDNETEVGLIDNSFARIAVVGINQTIANFFLRTADFTSSRAVSSIPKDTNFHTHKIDCGSADIKLTIDGVLQITKTTNRPDVRLQPWAFVHTDPGASGVKTLNMLYFEAYNKLATEADFPSVYEMFQELTTVSRQHFWDWFDGDSLNNRWVTESFGGTGTFGMVDEIDGGFSIGTPAADGAVTAIHFGDKRPFSPTSSVVIFVSKVLSTSLYVSQVGFGNDLTAPWNNQQATLESELSQAKFRLKTANTSQTITNTSVNVDLSFHSSKIECGAANIKLTLDGVLELTVTSTRPTLKLQPIIMTGSAGGAAVKTVVCRYIEAFNI